MTKLDKFEQEIENNAEKLVPASDKTRSKVKNAIANAKKKKRVTLRLSDDILDAIKEKAQNEGLPYQTFISSILYKYANDQLVDEKSILKSIKILEEKKEYSTH